jgi:hypothetical protein
VIYVYAIRDQGSQRPQELTGIDGAPIVDIDLGPLSAVASGHRQPDLRPTDDAVWDHERVVEAVMARASVVPARFGTTFADLQSLAQAVTPKTPGLKALLDRVRDRVELALRAREAHPGSLSVAPETRRAATSGRSYLEGRRPSATRLTLLARDIHRSLAALAADATEPVWQRQAITAAYLVDSHQIGAVTRVAEQLADRHSQVVLTLTGPWPPYSFVELG